MNKKFQARKVFPVTMGNNWFEHQHNVAEG